MVNTRVLAIWLATLVVTIPMISSLAFAEFNMEMNMYGEDLVEGYRKPSDTMLINVTAFDSEAGAYNEITKEQLKFRKANTKEFIPFNQECVTDNDIIYTCVYAESVAGQALVPGVLYYDFFFDDKHQSTKAMIVDGKAPNIAFTPSMEDGKISAEFTLKERYMESYTGDCSGLSKMYLKEDGVVIAKSDLSNITSCTFSGKISEDSRISGMDFASVSVEATDRLGQSDERFKEIFVDNKYPVADSGSLKFYDQDGSPISSVQADTITNIYAMVNVTEKDIGSVLNMGLQEVGGQEASGKCDKVDYVKADVTDDFKEFIYSCRFPATGTKRVTVPADSTNLKIFFNISDSEGNMQPVSVTDALTAEKTAPTLKSLGFYRPILKEVTVSSKAFKFGEVDESVEDTENETDELDIIEVVEEEETELIETYEQIIYVSPMGEQLKIIANISDASPGVDTSSIALDFANLGSTVLVEPESCDLVSSDTYTCVWNQFVRISTPVDNMRMSLKDKYGVGSLVDVPIVLDVDKTEPAVEFVGTVLKTYDNIEKAEQTIEEEIMTDETQIDLGFSSYVALDKRILYEAIIDESQSGLKEENVKLSIIGKDYLASNCTFIDTRWLCQWYNVDPIQSPLSDGTIEITLNVEDNSGNSALAIDAMYIDQTPPKLDSLQITAVNEEGAFSFIRPGDAVNFDFLVTDTAPVIVVADLSEFNLPSYTVPCQPLDVDKWGCNLLTDMLPPVNRYLQAKARFFVVDVLNNTLDNKTQMEVLKRGPVNEHYDFWDIANVKLMPRTIDRQAAEKIEMTQYYYIEFDTYRTNVEILELKFDPGSCIGVSDIIGYGDLSTEQQGVLKKHRKELREKRTGEHSAAEIIYDDGKAASGPLKERKEIIGEIAEDSDTGKSAKKYSRYESTNEFKAFNTKFADLLVPPTATWGSDAGNFNYLEADRVTVMGEDTKKPFLMMPLKTSKMEIDQIFYVCNFSIRSRVGNVALSNYENEGVPLAVQFYEMPFGSISKNLQKEINRARDSWIGPDSDFAKAIKIMRKIFDIAQGICTLLNLVYNVWLLLKLMLSVTGPMKGTVAFSAHFTACGVNVKQDAVLPGLYKFSRPFCGFITCDWDKVLGEGNPMGKFVDLVKNKIFNKINFGTKWFEQNKNEPDVSYMDPTSGKSLAVSALFLCIPGLIRGFDKYRQLQCMYVDCLQNEVPKGIPISACKAEKSYLECKYIYGEIFNFIPIFALWDYFMGILKQAFSDPLSMIGFVGGLVCGILCFGEENSYKACQYFMFATFITDMISQFQSLFGEEGFKKLFKGPSVDYCETLDGDEGGGFLGI